MGRISKYTTEQKLNAIHDYKSGKRSKAQICYDLGLNRNSGRSFYDWLNIFNEYGESGFLPKNRNKAYTKEFKKMVVQEYLKGAGSSTDLALKYDIPSPGLLRIWISKYNCHKELKDYNPRGEVYMTKARKTTLAERIEIVEYCKVHDNQYKLAAEYFDVSYAQVYKWVKKHDLQGEEGLKDKRGKHKCDEELDEMELLRRKVARLEKQLKSKKMENILLKKVKEIERRRYLPKGNKNQNT